MAGHLSLQLMATGTGSQPLAELFKKVASLSLDPYSGVNDFELPEDAVIVM